MQFVNTGNRKKATPAKKSVNYVENILRLRSKNKSDTRPPCNNHQVTVIVPEKVDPPINYDSDNTSTSSKNTVQSMSELNDTGFETMSSCSSSSSSLSSNVPNRCQPTQKRKLELQMIELMINFIESSKGFDINHDILTKINDHSANLQSLNKKINYQNVLCQKINQLNTEIYRIEKMIHNLSDTKCQTELSHDTTCLANHFNFPCLNISCLLGNVTINNDCAMILIHNQNQHFDVKCHSGEIILLDNAIDICKYDFCGQIVIHHYTTNTIHQGIIFRENQKIKYVFSNRPLLPLCTGFMGSIQVTIYLHHIHKLCDSVTDCK